MKARLPDRLAAVDPIRKTAMQCGTPLRTSRVGSGHRSLNRIEGRERYRQMGRREISVATISMWIWCCYGVLYSLFQAQCPKLWL